MEEKKLSEFLKENGAYESFVENYLKDKHNIERLSNRNVGSVGIFCGFVWDDTPQGIDFWKELSTKSLKFDTINDMDEILYKEYEKRNMKESSEQNPTTKDIVENNAETKLEDTKQEFQTITLNGIEYNLIPKEISVKYIAEWYDKDMKVETKKEFEPFTLNIEVNTLDEAKSLWNRFNLNNDTLCKSMGSLYYNVELQNIINDMKYWKQLDNILKDLGEEPDVK